MTAAVISVVLGYSAAPLIQSKLHEERSASHLQTVLASSQAPKSDVALALPTVETASIDQLRQMAEKGNPAAENALGLRYFQGSEKDGIAQNEKEAFRWFNNAAEHGNPQAQSKLGFLYWSGRGVPKDLNKAYFWTVIARARGDEGNRDLAAVLASGMTRAQAAAIQEQAGLLAPASAFHRQTRSRPLEEISDVRFKISDCNSFWHQSAITNLQP